MSTVEMKNASIKKVILGLEDHGFLTAMLILDYGDGSCQGFGGYSLYSPKYKDNGNFAGHFIWRVLQIAEVTDWNDLVGKTIRVQSDFNGVHRIGHIIKEDWFSPEEDFKSMKFYEEQANG